MNATEKAQILKDNDYRQKKDTWGNWAWYFKGEYLQSTDMESKADSTHEAYRHFLKSQSSEAPVTEASEEAQESEYTVKTEPFRDSTISFVKAPDSRVITVGIKTENALVLKDILNQETASLRQRISELDVQVGIATSELQDEISKNQHLQMQLEKQARMNINLAQQNVELQKAIERIKYRAERPSEDPFDAPADILAIIETLQLNAKQQPETAQAEVTLSDAELEWLAENQIKYEDGKFVLMELPIADKWKQSLRGKMCARFSHDFPQKHLELKPEYDTPANLAAIEKRRLELQS